MSRTEIAIAVVVIALLAAGAFALGMNLGGATASDDRALPELETPEVTVTGIETVGTPPVP